MFGVSFIFFGMLVFGKIAFDLCYVFGEIF